MHLIITEKHDTAKRIAAILSDKKPDKERVNGVDTYKFQRNHRHRLVRSYRRSGFSEGIQ